MGVVAGTVNTIAGGGSLITLPALILLGLPAGVANGTNRVGVVLQSGTAALQFQREGRLDLSRALALLLPTCLGSILGAWLSLCMEEVDFRRVIAVVMLLMVGVMLVKPRRWLEGRGDNPPAGRWSGLVFFGISIYGGFLQAGTGVFLLAALVLLEGLDLVRANGVKVFILTGFTLPAIAVFALSGSIAWRPALALAAGSTLGGWLGARLTMSWGPAFVRWVLVVVVLAAAGKLLGM